MPEGDGMNEVRDGNSLGRTTALKTVVVGRLGSLSFLAAAARRGDLAGAHQVTDVLLEKLVVVVEFVVLVFDGLDAMEDGEQRVLQRLGVLVKLVSSFAAQVLQIFAVSPWAHRAHVVGLRERPGRCCRRS